MKHKHSSQTVQNADIYITTSFLLFLDKIQKGPVNRQPYNEAAEELNCPFYGWLSSITYRIIFVTKFEGFRVGRLSMRSVNET